MISVAPRPPLNSQDYFEVQKNFKIYIMEMPYGSDVDDSMILLLKEMLFEKVRTSGISACKYLERGGSENSE